MSKREVRVGIKFPAYVPRALVVRCRHLVEWHIERRAQTGRLPWTFLRPFVSPAVTSFLERDNLSFYAHIGFEIPSSGTLVVCSAVLADERVVLSEQAANMLGWVSAVVPRRIAREELGDALEDIEARIAAGRRRGEITLKIYASVFWALWHTVLYAVKGVTDALGRKGG